MTPEDHATVAAYIAGVDKVAREHEHEWGIGRLEYLADDELRAKFGRQMAKWRSAIDAAYDTPDRSPAPKAVLDAVRDTGHGVARGWAALASTALADGHKPVEATVWEVGLANGSVAALVRTTAEGAKVLDDGRYKIVFTLDEVAHIFAINMAPIVTEAKRVFPGATVFGVRETVDRSWTKNGEQIPF